MSNAKVRVETIGAIIDGQPIGSIFEINERSAKAYEALGYVRIIKAEPQPVKKATAPKKPATKAKPKTTKDNVKK